MRFMLYCLYKEVFAVARPNIIMIMTDQQRYDAIGCVNPLVKTPGIDSLARNGVLFDQAVCQCPMCVPSRNSMMFGLYPSQTGVRTNSGALLDESRLPGIPLPQLLSDAGYFCAGFGKTHWNNTVKGAPGSRRGFHVRAEGQPKFSLQYEEGATMMDDEDAEGLKAYFEETSEFGSGEERAAGYIGKPSALAKEHHRDGFIHKKCIEFLDGYEPDGRPLFLYLSFIKPHAGFNIPPEFEALYDLKDIPPLPTPPWENDPSPHIQNAMNASANLNAIHNERKNVWKTLSDDEKRLSTLRYYANCSFMDHFIESVLKKIREKGLDKNTLFIFVSDHGEMMGERDYRFSKYCLFESSVRVPLILAGDCIDPALHATRDHRPAMLVDILPTICDAAGIEPNVQWPGESLLAKETKRKGAFSEYHGSGSEKTQIAPAWMWRNENYKLIYTRPGFCIDESSVSGEMYDLTNDPNEWQNIFDKPAYRDIRERMTIELLENAMNAFAKAPAFGDYRGTDKLKK